MEQHKSIWLLAVSPIGPLCSCCFASRNLCIYMFFFFLVPGTWAAAPSACTRIVVSVWAAFGHSFDRCRGLLLRYPTDGDFIEPPLPLFNGNMLAWRSVHKGGQTVYSRISGGDSQNAQKKFVGTKINRGILCILNNPPTRESLWKGPYGGYFLLPVHLGLKGSMLLYTAWGCKFLACFTFRW